MRRPHRWVIGSDAMCSSNTSRRNRALGAGPVITMARVPSRWLDLLGPDCDASVLGVRTGCAGLVVQGVGPVAMSGAPPGVSLDLGTRAGYTLILLSEPKAEVIRRYNLLHAGGSPEGVDISRPAEFLVDSHGVVRWVNLTDDVRVRARADQMLAAARAIQ